MINSYIVTFDSSNELDMRLEEIKKLNVSIESVQYFIGTVVIICEPSQAAIIKNMDHVIGVIESGTMHSS